MCTIYEAVSRIEKYLSEVKDESVRDALETLLSSVRPRMLVPVKMPDGSIVNVSNLKANRIPIYQKFCKDHAPLVQSLYLYGSALTEQCCEETVSDFMFVLNCSESEWRKALALYLKDYPNLTGDNWISMHKDVWDYHVCKLNVIVREVRDEGAKIYDLSW